MRKVRQVHTGPEVAVRRALHAAGFRYRVNLRVSRAVASRADVVFRRQKVAVYIDGCFWHGCPVHATSPRRNAEWWAEKLKANRERDARTSRILELDGWIVIRLWAHEHPNDAVKRVRESLAKRARRRPNVLDPWSNTFS